MYPFDLLDVEPDLPDAVTNIKVEEPFRRIEGMLGQHGDHVKWGTLILQQADRPHRPLVSAEPPSCAPVGVVNVRRSVNAEPHPGADPDKKPCPILVHQQTVGLKAM